jgi:NitT/TauT family transport system permease protein
MNIRAISTDVLLGIVPIALSVVAWQGISSFGYAPVTLLPPGLVFMRLAQRLATDTFQHAIVATLFRLFAGFSIAVILGVGIGLPRRPARPSTPLCGRSMGIGAVAESGLYPALLLLLGFGHESRSFWSLPTLFPILLSTYYGASMVEQKLIWSAMAAGAASADIVQGGVASSGAVYPYRVPHWACDFLHRGVSR